MAFWNRPRPTVRAVTASAARIKVGSQSEISRLQSRYKEWQRLGWAYLRAIPEARNGVHFNAGAISKVRIIPAKLDDPDEDPTPVLDNPDLLAPIDRLNRGPGGSYAGLLRRGHLNLTVPGEFYVIGTGLGTDDETWDAYSRSEVTYDGSRIIVRRTSTTTGDTAPMFVTGDDFILRIWYPDGEYAEEPDSPMRAVLSSCENLILADKVVRATLRTHMNAGFLLVPKEFGLGPTEPSTQSVGDGEELDDPFLQDTIDNLRDSEDEDSLSSQVPHIVHADYEYLDGFKHIPIGRQFDQVLDTRLEREISRLLSGLNVIPDQVRNPTGTNRWTPTQIPEESFSSYIEPDLVLMLDALTVGYYRPELVAGGMSEEDADRHVLWYDASRVIAKPNKVQEAKDAHDRFVLSDAAYRSRAGMREEEAPDETEIERRIRQRMAGRQMTAPQVPTGRQPTVKDELPTPDSPTNVPEPVKTASGAPTPAATLSNGSSTVNSGSDTVTTHHSIGRRLYDLDHTLATRLEASCHAAVRNALNVAGAKVRAKAKNQKAVAASITACDNSEVLATLGPSTVTNLGFDPADLVKGMVLALQPQFDMWVEAAQKAAFNIIEVPITPQIQRLYDASREKAWRYLSEELVKTAVDRLWEGPAVKRTDDGESSGLLVPFKIVRLAMAIAGSDTISRGKLYGGIGVGHIALKALRDAGATLAGYEWAYGPALRRTDYEPHRRLDGIHLDENFYAPELQHIGGIHSFGQSDGCACALIPLVTLTPKGA